ncbi:MAG: Hsp20/alpha crystallin family protein [Thiotrichales bacterium]
MALVTYDPWNVFEQMRKEMDRAIANRNDEGSKVATADWAPAVDIKEDPDQFLLLADIPGVDPKDIEVHMENGVLTIRGERKSESKEEHAGYKRVERVYGSFYRRFSLPDTADAERISARSQNGVLAISIPKHEKVQPRRIAVAGE